MNFDLQSVGINREGAPDPEESVRQFNALSAGRGAELAAILDDLRIHASIVGHDFRLQVLFSSPYSGGGYLPNPPTVYVDPVEALTHPDRTRASVGHEAAHRYNTYSPEHPQMRPFLSSNYPIEKLIQTPGFLSVLAAIEDVAVNTWYCRVYPGAREGIHELYQENFQSDPPQLYTPEIKLAEQQLGFFPKYAQFLSAVMRKWHMGEWGSVPDQQVLSALQDTEAIIDQSVGKTDPTTGAQETDRINFALERYLYFLEGVWPVVQSLIAADRAEAGFQSFMQSAMDALGGEGEDSPGESDAESDQTGSATEGEGATDPESGGVETADPEGQAGDQVGEGAGSSSPNGSSIDALLAGLSNVRREELQDLLGCLGENLQGTGEQVQMDDSLEAQSSSQDISDELESELREFYEGLYDSQRGGFEQRGEFNLRALEDAVNELLRSNLDSHAVPSFREQRAADLQRAQSESRQREEEAIAQEIEHYRRNLLGAWDGALEAHGEEVLRLTNLLRRVLRPIVPKRTGGYQSGVALSLPHVMRDEARPLKRYDIFESISLPKRQSYLFQLVGDRSESMLRYGKNIANVQGLASAAEALSKANVPLEIAAFDSDFALLKGRQDPFDRAKKEQVAQALLDCDGGTADYVAIRTMAERALSAPVKRRVMLVTSDGESRDANKLRSELRWCAQHGIIVIGLGIGSATGDVNRNYLFGRGLLTLFNEGHGDSFFEYLSQMISDLVQDPGKYFSKIDYRE